MRTTLTIDDKIAKDLIQITKSDSLIDALKSVIDEYLKTKQKQKLLSLFGKIDLDLDVTELRNRELKHDRR